MAARGGGSSLSPPHTHTFPSLQGLAGCSAAPGGHSFIIPPPCNEISPGAGGVGRRGRVAPSPQLVIASSSPALSSSTRPDQPPSSSPRPPPPPPFPVVCLTYHSLCQEFPQSIQELSAESDAQRNRGLEDRCYEKTEAGRENYEKS